MWKIKIFTINRGMELVKVLNKWVYDVLQLLWERIGWKVMSYERNDSDVVRVVMKMNAE